MELDAGELLLLYRSLETALHADAAETGLLREEL